ncbi:MAG: hypothetical protein M3Z15_08165 [Pseudomonadota bacterium]|nr:hypothetical protein [Pseudomonadota bacterium]
MSPQDRSDDRVLAGAQEARDIARSGVEAAVGHLAQARALGADTARILERVRCLRVAQQRHLETLEELAVIQRALCGELPAPHG